MNIFLKVLRFIKQYPGILYSFLLIVILPLVLYYSTFLIANSFEENINANLRNQALMVGNVLGYFFSQNLEDPETLQIKIEEIIAQNPQIKNLRVAVEEKGEFQILASQNFEEKGIKIKEEYFTRSYFHDQAIANLISEKGERMWNLVQPVYDNETGEKLGLISMAFSLKESDALIAQTISRAYIIVLIAIVLVLFLIFQHTRLFGYVSLTKRLQEIDKMKDAFIRMATHELQSPIVNIRGYLLTLKEEIGSSLDEKQKEYFSRADISAKNLVSLIEDILEVSRIEQGRLDFRPQKIQPQEIIREVVGELKLKAEKKGLGLFFEESRAPFYIEVNRNRFRQILFNLVDNAVKYTFEGKIEIETKRDLAKKRYYINITDTGLGISAEDQKRLFEKFYRVKTRETAEIPGTGLGLWISKELCQRMDGEILLESIKGKGSKFTVVFPLAK